MNLAMARNGDTEDVSLDMLLWDVKSVCSIPAHDRFWEFVTSFIPAYAKIDTEELVCRIYAVDEAWSRYLMLMQVGKKEYFFDCKFFNDLVKALPYERTRDDKNRYGEWQLSDHWGKKKENK